MFVSTNWCVRCLPLTCPSTYVRRTLHDLITYPCLHRISLVQASACAFLLANKTLFQVSMFNIPAMVKLCQHKYTWKNMVDMEGNMLRTLRWSLTGTSPSIISDAILQVIEHDCKATDIATVVADPTFRTTLREFHTLCLKEQHLQVYSASELAWSSIESTLDVLILNGDLECDGTTNDLAAWWAACALAQREPFEAASASSSSGTWFEHNMEPDPARITACSQAMRASNSAGCKPGQW